MTTALDLDPFREAAMIAAQNDAFRRSILGNPPVADAPQGQFVMTRGVAALGPDAQLELTRHVAAFDAFNADSDPQGWHEMGGIEFDGTTVWFKIDLYDVDYTYGSPEAATPHAFLNMIEHLAGLAPSHTRRSEDSVRLQQFSTPLPLAAIVAQAAGFRGDDLVLEPSAGTGMLAIFARIAGARLSLNELAETRRNLLQQLFPEAVVSDHDAASIDDRLDRSITPSVIVMNPPFSAANHVEGQFRQATSQHVLSSLARLAPGGRLLVITGESFRPSTKCFQSTFQRIGQSSEVVFSAAIDGKVFSRHGTSIDTRLTVIDKRAMGEGETAPVNIDGAYHPTCATTAALLSAVLTHCPERRSPPPCPTSSALSVPTRPTRTNLHALRNAARQETRALAEERARHPFDDIEMAPLDYLPKAWSEPDGVLQDTVYEAYDLQAINLESPYARAALRQFFYKLRAGKIEACSYAKFQEMTGLTLDEADGTMKENLPPIRQFLNRCLALRIDMQDAIFEAFGGFLSAIIEDARQAGTLDVGLETLRAEKFVITDRRVIFEHEATGATATALTVERTDRNDPLTLPRVKAICADMKGATLCWNKTSKRAALMVKAPAFMDEDGVPILRVKLLRPMATEILALSEFSRSHWEEIDDAMCEHLWQAEVDAVPKFTTSKITLICGLLLPIWDRLPSDNSRAYLSAKRRKETEVHCPEGTRIAFSGGDYQAYDLIWSVLDATHAKYPDMVLLHGGTPKGAEMIAARWADTRGVTQVVFKPDWKSHGKAAPFKRNDKMLETMPQGLIATPGSGITENIVDKARKLGIRIKRIGA